MLQKNQFFYFPELRKEIQIIFENPGIKTEKITILDKFNGVPKKP